MNGRRTVYRRLLNGWVLGIVELMMFFPLWLTASVLLLPQHLQAGWLLGIPVMTLCGMLISLRIRTAWIRGAAAIVPAAAYTSLFLQASWQDALAFAAALTAVVRGMAVLSPEDPSADVKRYIGGVASYFIGYIVFLNVAEWKAYLPWLTGAGIVSLAIALFAVNRRVLQQESFSAEPYAAARAMQGFNRLLVILVLGIAVILTLAVSGALGRWLWAVLHTVLSWLFAGRSEPQQAPQPAQPPAAPPALPKGGGRGWFQQALDVLFYVVGACAIGLLLFLLIRLVYRNRRTILAFVKRMWFRIALILGRKKEPEVFTGYVDEETDLFSWQAVERGIREKLQRFGGRNRDSWSELHDNREKVRYLYREWLRKLRKKGYAPKPHLTPDETLYDVRAWKPESGDSANSVRAAEIIGLYYKSRYGGKSVTDEEIGNVLAGGSGNSSTNPNR